MRFVPQNLASDICHIPKVVPRLLLLFTTNSLIRNIYNVNSLSFERRITNNNTRDLMRTRKKNRKVYLYRGNEAISSYAQPSTDSLLATLRAMRHHFKRNPTLTHAEIIDSQGKHWTVTRNIGRLGLLWLRLRVK